MEPGRTPGVGDADRPMVPLAVICKVIDLARTAPMAPSEPRAHPPDRSAADPGRSRARLVAVLSELPEAALVDLIALVWLGRMAGAWPDALDLAERHGGAASVAYLAGRLALADDLTAGLAALGLGCGDLPPDSDRPVFGSDPVPNA